MPEWATPFIPFQTDHIVAQQHRVEDSIDNLALACDKCNAYKGTNLSSIDSESSCVVKLYHPRMHIWEHHFQEIEGVIVGLTSLE